MDDKISTVTAQTDKRVVGRPFPKGTSGNPNGRPKGIASKVREATNDGQDLIQLLVDMAQGRIKGASARDRLEAAKVLLDRGHGKAVETTVQVQADAREAETGALGDLVDAELEAMARALKDPATVLATPLAPGDVKYAESLTIPETTD